MLFLSELASVSCDKILHCDWTTLLSELEGYSLSAQNYIIQDLFLGMVLDNG